LGQLQTKIKVRLTKQKSSREITVYSLHPALGNFPTLLLGILLPLLVLPILAGFTSEVQTLPPNTTLQCLDHQIRCHEKGLTCSSRRGFGYTQIPGWSAQAGEEMRKEWLTGKGGFWMIVLGFRVWEACWKLKSLSPHRSLSEHWDRAEPLTQASVTDVLVVLPPLIHHDIATHISTRCLLPEKEHVAVSPVQVTLAPALFFTVK